MVLVCGIFFVTLHLLFFEEAIAIYRGYRSYRDYRNLGAIKIIEIIDNRRL